MTPMQLQQNLLKLLNDLSTSTENLTQCEKEYTEAENEYKKEYSKAYLLNKTKEGKPTVAEIDHKTYLDTEGYKTIMDIKESLYKAKKSELDTIRIKIDTLRTLLSYNKAELERTTN